MGPKSGKTVLIIKKTILVLIFHFREMFIDMLKRKKLK